MTEKEYRAHPAASRSDLWALKDSPAKYKWNKEHPEEPTPALLLGQVLHKLVLQPESFSDEFAVAPVVDRRTKDGRAAYEAFVQASDGKTVISADLLEQAKGMVESLKAEPLVNSLLQGEAEKPFFWADELTGEACKVRVDMLNTNLQQPVIVDIKTTTDASVEGFTRSAIKYGYDLQAGMYSEGVERCIGQKPLFVFVVVEKQPPYSVNIFQADDLLVQRGKDLFRELLGIYHDCKQSGNWYGYLGKFNQINTLALPAWLAKEA